ncbi:Protein RDM1, plant [Dillenia turbinata]|uniref:Protein RDM1, plant n=1 Tax=Dillenia turbinata TaxID=194707 RepID=A0AAN8ZDP0_9MAGN
MESTQVHNKCNREWIDIVDVSSSDDSSSDSDSSSSEMDLDLKSVFVDKVAINDSPANQLAKVIVTEDPLLRRAKMYQDYMMQIQIPTLRGSLIPFKTWMQLGRSIKQIYGQPLHYLTNILLKQWDELRIGSEDEEDPLDTMMHPCKAEATIWLMEEVHRRTASYHHLSKLWLSDKMYHVYIDPIFPDL